jgi:hypothetical protein
MLGLASKTKAAGLPRVGSNRVFVPRRPACVDADGTGKMRANSAFVSRVPPVSPYLELIEDYRKGKWRSHGDALIGPRLPALRQVGPAQRWRGFPVGQQGETHVRRWDSVRYDGGTLLPSCRPVVGNSDAIRKRKGSFP